MATNRTLARVQTPSGMVSAVGAAVALCIMGDSLMYSILPLYAVSAGIALPLVGILLSANRVIRLASNQWAGTAFQRYGAKVPFLVSVLLGLASTVVYGMAAGFIVFLFARIAWGIAWSGLRQGGYIATWYGRPGVRGRLTGLLLGIVRLGSAVGVVVGGVLYDRYGFVVAVGAVSALGAVAIPLALSIPWLDRTYDPAASTGGSQTDAESSATWQDGVRLAFSQPAYRWLSIASFFAYMVGGIIVSTTSIFVAAKISLGSDAIVLGIATVTGLLHGARWLANILVGPLAGALSDRIGRSNTMLILSTSMLGLMLFAGVALPGAAIMAFLLVLLLDGSLVVVVSAAGTTVATDTASPQRFIATFATLTDAGSALGPLIAFSALATTQLPIVYAMSTTILVACVVRYWQLERVQHPSLQPAP